MGLILLVVLVLAVAMHYGAFGERWRSRFRRAMAPALAPPLGFLGGLAWGVFRAAADSD